HKEMKVVCTNIGFAMRCAVLCDLFLNKRIGLGPDGSVCVFNSSGSAIEKDFLYKIDQCRCNASQLLRALNGESSRNLSIRHLRSRAYKELESRGILRIEKTLVYKKIVLTDMDVWEKLHKRLLAECRSGKLSMESKVLLTTLNYVNRMESILLQCNEVDAVIVTKIFDDLRLKIKQGHVPDNERLIYSFLGILVK
ncbi:hypothetical protein PAEPH01_1860, partial [Pancytospora epiphaga]